MLDGGDGGDGGDGDGFESIVNFRVDGGAAAFTFVGILRATQMYG